MTQLNDLKADFGNPFNKWPHFTAKEMACRETGEEGIGHELMCLLSTVRKLCGFPFVITSGYRSLSHPVEAAKIRAGKEPGTHHQGIAVDIAISGDQAFTLLRHAIWCGFTGIGIKQSGPHAKRFIHLDMREKPALWSYK